MNPVTDYHEYEPHLRIDFWFSCAYCSITEREARAIGFEIDHYIPSSREPLLKHDYSNLMWSCAHCNSNKWDYYPPDAAVAAGVRIIRPDEDDPRDHFSADGYKLKPLTAAGTFTEQLLILNRPSLQELRKLRAEIFDAVDALIIGLHALENVPIDGLKSRARMYLLRVREQASARAEERLAALDAETLRLASMSELLDGRRPADLAKERRKYLEECKGAYPGQWRTSKRKRSGGSRKKGKNKRRR